MSRKTFFKSLGAVLLLLLVVVYMGYQVMENLTEKIVTADALQVTAQDKISANGIFVRQETPLYPQQGGTVAFLADEGEKVAKGQAVAQFFTDENQLALYRQSQSLGEEIESVKYAFTHMTDGSDGVKLDSLIKMNMLQLGAKLDQGLVSQAEEYSSKLDAMIVQRGVAQKGDTDYAAILQELESQKAQIDASLQGGTAVTTPAAGYFVGRTDGCEESLTPEGLKTLSADAITQVVERKEASSEAIGKVVDGYSWYFAAQVTADEAKRLKEVSKVTLRFPQLLAEDISCSVYDVHQDESGEWVAVLQSGYMNTALLMARDQPADIILRSYTGLKVPKEALRQNEDGEWGAYCLEGAQVVFKKITILFQTDSFYVAKDTGKNGELTRYDKMVVKAKDIENRKVVS
ncbi:hypothetical protein DW094_12445 [Ruminococcaceae bacterium AM07-15]|nr:hypothetical protein DW094_12445 [Ruminococcaceae bacterium AM07-15]